MSTVVWILIVIGAGFVGAGICYVLIHMVVSKYHEVSDG